MLTPAAPSTFGAVLRLNDICFRTLSCFSSSSRIIFSIASFVAIECKSTKLLEARLWKEGRWTNRLFRSQFPFEPGLSTVGLSGDMARGVARGDCVRALRKGSGRC